jgi:GNAT superfamily N-acetyltransferase
VSDQDHYGIALKTPRGELAIRLVRASDVDAIRDLRLEALQRHPEAFGRDYESAAAEPREYWLNVVRPASAYNALFIADAGEHGLAGMTGVFRENSRRTEHAATVWGVYIRSQWRGLRLSDALLLACETWGRENGVRIMKLIATSTNSHAIAAYVRCGYRVYGVDPQGIYANGVYYADLLMCKELV